MKSLWLLVLLLPISFKLPTMHLETQKQTESPDIPLLREWSGPYGGVPDFNQYSVDQMKEALEIAMDTKFREIEAIGNNPKAPDFANTIEALENSGKMLDRVMTIYGIWSNNLSTEQFRKIETEMEPKLAAFDDKITQFSPLFKRIESVYNASQHSETDPEKKRLTWLYYRNFVRSGAKLNAEEKARLSAINQQLATLYTGFGQNLLADENDRFVRIDNESELAGLSEQTKEAYAEAGVQKKLPGKWVILNTRSSVDPFLTYAENRTLREKVWKMFINRGDNGDEHDNNASIVQILKLRRERALLLGYQTHAHWRLENSMAGSPQKAMDLLMSVWKPATQRVQEEVRDMQAIADAEKAGIRIEPWDYRYYAEKVRKQRYDLDQNEVKNYLQLDRLREAMFRVALNLFNLQFTPVSDVPVYHPDVQVWKVSDATSGRHIGLWYFDAFAREGKRSGAWMNSYRAQHKLGKAETTIVSNNSNFVKGKPGEPVLISWDDATTLFHEFGHALHGLCSDVTYPSMSGTAVFRDYVEFPSQLLEHWLSTPEVLSQYALHFQTAEPLPTSLRKKIENAATFNEGFSTTEYLASAIIDMKLHLDDPNSIDPDRFESETLKSLGMPAELVMRHRTPQFAHVFSGDGYSAGYYSYLWSDVLTADAWGAFTEAGGAYDPQVALRLKKHVFSCGNTVDPAEAYRKFRGRDADTKALMKKRGFPVE